MEPVRKAGIRLAVMSLAAVLSFSAGMNGAYAQLENPRVNALVQSSAPTRDMSAVAAAQADSNLMSINSETQNSGMTSSNIDCVPRPFGQSLFDGAIQKSSGTIMSPKQRVVPGDRVKLAIWGAVETEEVTSVDSQGFIYIKGVGPVYVEGKTEDSLAAEIKQQISRVFKNDVQVYATLEQNAGTPVMVTGGVNRPGQYYGSAQDSSVVWLQRAGGISPQQGSYRDISILRDGKQLGKIDLYPFLQQGHIEQVPWINGDVVVVGNAGMQVAVTGDVRRCAVFEFSKDAAMAGEELVNLAQPMPGATHAVLSGHRNGQPYTQVYSVQNLRQANLRDGDKVRFYAAPQNEQLTVNIEGPTLGNRILILPLHTNLSDALELIPVDKKISNTDAIYIRRVSVAASQQRALNESTQRLLQSALTAPASSDGEAVIRAKEAELIEAFVSSAKMVRQEGRVVVMQHGNLRDLPLEDGDTIVIPQKTDVVSIEGEVVLPRTIVVKPNATAEDYVMMSGGYTERALKSNYIVIHPNGDAERGDNVAINAGDRLLILPKVDTKTMQTTKDIVQILYQVAVGAGVLLSVDD